MYDVALVHVAKTLAAIEVEDKTSGATTTADGMGKARSVDASGQATSKWRLTFITE
jgi:hypothetical protein